MSSTQHRTRPILLAAAALAGAALLFGAAAAPTLAEEAKLDFSLPNPDGKTVTLQQFLDKGPVLVDFWATWCKPCKKELPYLEEIYKQYGPKGLTVVAISQDGSRSASKVKPFIESQRYSFPVLLDPNGDAKRRFNALEMPTLVLIDKQGKRFYTHVGYNPGDEKELREKVAALFGEKIGG